MAKEVKALRFFVSDQDGHACPAWRVWINENKSDVYFAHRELAGEMKGSLHESGSWQYGLTEPRAKGEPIQGWSAASRHLKIWNRPRELSAGLTRAVSIGIPSSELQSLPAPSGGKSAIQIGAPPIGQGVEVTFFLASAIAELGGNFPGEHDMATSLLAKWLLPSGELLYVVHRTYEIPSVTILDLDTYRRQFQHLRDTPTARARFAIFGMNDIDGSAFIVEGAVHPDLPSATAAVSALRRA